MDPYPRSICSVLLCRNAHCTCITRRRLISTDILLTHTVLPSLLPASRRNPSQIPSAVRPTAAGADIFPRGHHAVHPPKAGRIPRATIHCCGHRRRRRRASYVGERKNATMFDAVFEQPPRRHENRLYVKRRRNAEEPFHSSRPIRCPGIAS